LPYLPDHISSTDIEGSKSSKSEGLTELSSSKPTTSLAIRVISFVTPQPKSATETRINKHIFIVGLLTLRLQERHIIELQLDRLHVDTVFVCFF